MATRIIHRRGKGIPAASEFASVGEILIDTDTGTGYTLREPDGAVVALGGDGSGPGPGAGMVISPTEPADPVDGMQWLDSTTARVWVWDEDKWLEFPAAGGSAEGSGLIEVSEEPPEPPYEIGQQWFSSTDGYLYIWYGNEWVAIGGAGGGDGGGSHTATASGSISAGAAVVVNADSTVSEIQQIAGTPSWEREEISPIRADGTQVLYCDDTQCYVQIWRKNDDSNKGYYRVGTTSGTDIDWGASIKFIDASFTVYKAFYDPVSKTVLVAYTDFSTSARELVASIGKVEAGNRTIDWVGGVATKFPLGTGWDYAKDLEGDIDKATGTIFLSAASNGSPSLGVRAIACRTDGTTVTAGSMSVPSAETTAEGSALAWDYDKKILYSVDQQNTSTTDTYLSVYCTSMNDLDFAGWEGTGQKITPDRKVNNPKAVYDPSNAGIIIMATDQSYALDVLGESGRPVPWFGFAEHLGSGSFRTVSGYPAPQTGVNSSQSALVYDSSVEAVIFAGADRMAAVYNDLLVAEVKFDGSSFAFLGSSYIANERTDSIQDARFIDALDTLVLVPYMSSPARVELFRYIAPFSTNLTSDNFIGFASESVSSGSDVTVDVVGAVHDKRGGLISGRKYYVHDDGSIRLGASTRRAAPRTSNIFAGVAVSPSEIIVKG